MNKFKNCYEEANKLFSYDIEIDGEIVATAHTLTALDLAVIEEKSMKKTITETTREIDINSMRKVLYTVYRALDSWILNDELTLENLAKHPMLNDLYMKVNEHEEDVQRAYKDNEKN